MPTRPSAFLSPNYHDLIGLIYDSITSEEGFFPFLKRFIELFDGHSASFSIYDTRAETMVGFWVVNMPDHALAFYAEHVAHRDALVNTALTLSETGKARFVASNLDLGENALEIRKQTRADEWLSTYGAREAAGAIAFRDEHYLNFFGMQRSDEQPEFTRGELAVFDLLLPHISRAVALYTRMSALNLEHTPERLALNHVQRGILIYDANFRMVFKNATADTLIDANSTLSLNDEGLLRFRDKEFGQRFVLAMANAVKASIERSDIPETVLCYRKGAQNMTAVISPLTTADSTAEGQVHRGGAMLSLYDWSMRPSIDPQTLRHFFGLTEAEARVCALLAQGDSPSEIADRLNRSRETVRSHLKSVYRKTRTTRQGELVALLSTTSGVG